MKLSPETQKILDRMEPAIRNAFLESVNRVKSAAQRKLIIGHLEKGNVEAAVNALRIEAAFFQPLDRAIEEAYWQGGIQALAALPSLPDPFPEAEWFSALTDATRALNFG